MASYTFIPLDAAGLLTFSSWFADAELRCRVEAPTPVWFDYVRNTPGIYAWLVRMANDAIGFVQLDSGADQQANIELVVRPGQRHRGHGQAILRTLLHLPEVTSLRSIEASIAADNAASVRCFTAVGFSPESPAPDSDGFLKLVYTKQNIS